VDTPVNRSVAQEIWAAHPNRSHLELLPLSPRPPRLADHTAVIMFRRECPYKNQCIPRIAKFSQELDILVDNEGGSGITRFP